VSESTKYKNNIETPPTALKGESDEYKRKYNESLTRTRKLDREGDERMNE
jgi:hypothetical protein